MNDSFCRIITLLRKERMLSQKAAAADLNISQALLSHYEKGIRECGLDFVVRVADYYNVSCDYLLGRTPERNGAKLTVDDIPDQDEFGKENVFRGSVLPTLNKRLIFNSLNIVFDILQKYNNKSLTTEVSTYLMVAVYNMFRTLYSAEPKNPQDMFAVPSQLYKGFSSSALSIADANASCIASGKSIGNMKGLKKDLSIPLSPDTITKEYPLLSSSLYNLIQTSETRMGAKKNNRQ